MIIRLRLLAGLTAAALVPLATITGPAAATTGSACPDGDVPAAGFADTAANAHAGSIDCAVWWGITGGTSADTYTPSGTLTRAQLASMLARLVEKADRAPTEVASQGFRDMSGNAHARNIDMVAQLGVVGGYADNTFRPGQPVTRAQVASMLVRLETNVFGGTFPVGDANFDDIDGNVHRDAILHLVGAGVTQGVSATSFGPGAPVTRAQMATFVMRHVDRHVADGTFATPTSSEEPPAEEEPAGPGKGESESPCVVETLIRSTFPADYLYAEESVMDNGIGRHCSTRTDHQIESPAEVRVGVDTWERVMPAESIARMYSGEDAFVGDIGVGKSATVQYYPDSNSSWIYVELPGTALDVRIDGLQLSRQEQVGKLIEFARTAIPMLWPSYDW